MLAVLAVARSLRLCVCVIGVLSKWLDGSSWFLVRRLPANSVHIPFIRKFGYIKSSLIVVLR